MPAKNLMRPPNIVGVTARLTLTGHATVRVHSVAMPPGKGEMRMYFTVYSRQGSAVDGSASAFASVSDSTSASVTSCAADSAAAAATVVPMISSALGRGECERGAKGMAAEPTGKPRASRGETRPEMSMGERFDGAYTA
jgi:hypothetical protein